MLSMYSSLYKLGSDINLHLPVLVGNTELVPKIFQQLKRSLNT